MWRRSAVRQVQQTAIPFPERSGVCARVGGLCTSFLLQFAECDDSMAPAHCFSAAPTGSGTTRQLAMLTLPIAAPSPAPQNIGSCDTRTWQANKRAMVCVHKNLVPTHDQQAKIVPDPSDHFSPTKNSQKMHPRGDSNPQP